MGANVQFGALLNDGDENVRNRFRRGADEHRRLPFERDRLGPSGDDANWPSFGPVRKCICSSAVRVRTRINSRVKYDSMTKICGNESSVGVCLIAMRLSRFRFCRRASFNKQIIRHRSSL